MFMNTACGFALGLSTQNVALPVLPLKFTFGFIFKHIVYFSTFKININRGKKGTNWSLTQQTGGQEDSKRKSTWICGRLTRKESGNFVIEILNLTWH